MRGSASPASSHDLRGEANAQRTRVVGELIATGIVVIVTFVSAVYASYRRRQETAQVYAALSRLDDRLPRATRQPVVGAPGRR